MCVCTQTENIEKRCKGFFCGGSQPLCVCFAYLKTNLLSCKRHRRAAFDKLGWLLEDRQMRVCNDTHKQLLDVYGRSAVQRSTSRKAVKRVSALFPSDLPLRVPRTHPFLLLRPALVKLGRLFRALPSAAFTFSWTFRVKHRTSGLQEAPLFISVAIERPTLCCVLFTGEFTADDGFRVARDTNALSLRGDNLHSKY